MNLFVLGILVILLPFETDASPGNQNARCFQSPLINSALNIRDQDWVTFEYGPKGHEVYNAFIAASETPMILRITDTVNPGAAFIVHDHKNEILVTPIPKPDVMKSTFNPLRAYNSPSWSHGDVILSAGFHHIRVYMRASPLGKGFGAIKVDNTTKCSYELGKYFIVQSCVGWEEAGRLCEAYGGQLANIHRHHEDSKKLASLLDQTFKLINRCKVEKGLVWVAGLQISMMSGSADLGEVFPASIQAISKTEGFMGADWENQKMAVLCEATPEPKLKIRKPISHRSLSI